MPRMAPFVRGVKDRDKEDTDRVLAARGKGRLHRRASHAPRRYKFRVAFDELDQRLAQHPYLTGDNLSVLDIAWLIYAHRLWLGGYPFARLHPRVAVWKERLRDRSEFAKEIGDAAGSGGAARSHAAFAGGGREDTRRGGGILSRFLVA